MWSPDEASIPAVLHLPPPFGKVSSWLGLSLGFLVRPVPLGSCEILWLVLSRGYVLGASSLGVVTRVWGFSWQRVSSNETASAPLLVSLSLRPELLTVATRTLISSPIIIVILWR